MRRGWPFFVAAISGGFCGYVDLILAEVFFVALLICAISMTLGVIRPKHGWLLGLIVGLGVPAAHVGAKIIHFDTSVPNRIFSSFLPVIPAVIGGAGGAIMRYLLEQLTDKAS
jgi:hypothetical protein